ncbi:MAG: tetratricopeptide repeat protein [Isosphaeraceae bacterium]
MSTAYQRGIVLFQQGRYDLADREFRQELASDPDNPQAHAFLALCLSEQKRNDDALREADEAVRLEPDEAFGHYARGRILCDQERFKDAEAAAREAIRLDPVNAGYFGLLAGAEMGRRRWAEALDAAGRGLAIDPEDPGCTNLRAMALVQLGRKDEAEQALGSALANDPENALTHANQGWALLHQGDHQRALEHFREALRIDPNLDWARGGIVEALKARYLIYRLMLRFFLWIGRQSTVAQWVVILAIVFGRSILASIARTHPALEPFVLPVLALTFGFLLLTWIASPLFNLLLRLNRFGRLALSRDQRISSTWIGACFVAAAGFFVTDLVHPTSLTFLGMMYFGFLLMPLAVTFNRPPGKPRRVMAVYTGSVALMGLPILSLALLGPASPWKDGKLASELFTYCIYGSVFSTWIAAFLGSRFEA